MPTESGPNVPYSRRLLVAVDIYRYSERTDPEQHRVQEALHHVLDVAADKAGLGRASWWTQDGGDAEFAVLPPDEPEARLVDDFVHHLRNALDTHNGASQDRRRLRIRLAIHHGMVGPARKGWAGGGAVVIRRLVDCPPLKAALVEALSADLAVALSREVFEDTVARGHTSLAVGDFRKVDVRVKEFASHAWIYLPGDDVHALDLGGDDPSPPPTTAPAARRTPPTFMTEVRDVTVRRGDAVFGQKIGRDDHG